MPHYYRRQNHHTKQTYEKPVEKTTSKSKNSASHPKGGDSRKESTRWVWGIQRSQDQALNSFLVLPRGIVLWKRWRATTSQSLFSFSLQENRRAKRQQVRAPYFRTHESLALSSAKKPQPFFKLLAFSFLFSPFFELFFKIYRGLLLLLLSLLWF